MSMRTKFSEFRHAAETWIGERIVGKLQADLDVGVVPANLLDVFPTANGLISVIEKDGQLFVTKVLLHISDQFISYLNELADIEYKAKNYDAHNLVSDLCRYHFLQCPTLSRMFRIHRKFRYKQSRRKDGKFHFMFLKGKQVDVQREEQKLYACKNCLAQLSRLKGHRYNWDNFTPEMFFSSAFPEFWLIDGVFSTDGSPNLYPEYFRRISQRVREIKGYTCEKCGICLAADDDHRFLDCHHLHANKLDNSYFRLQALCVKCHSECDLHGHMKGSSRYREFVEKFHSESARDG